MAFDDRPAAWRGAIISAMPEPSPRELLARFTALPAAGPLMRRLRDGDAVYVVGGAVRDLLLGLAPLDLDLVVDGDLEALAARLGTPTRSHDRFGTSTVVVDGVRYDLARARQERYARPGALPTVAPASIDEDLRRRDFTVNALALALGGERRGELLAVPGGIDDLRDGVLRVLHDASFIDDPTRLLRLARYAHRLGFAAEERTRMLAGTASRTGAVATVSGTRLGAELQLLTAEPDPVGAFRALAEHGADGAIEPGFGLESDAQADLAWRALLLLPADGDPGAVVLAVAADGVAADRRAPLFDRLGLRGARRDRILAAANRARSVAQALAAAGRPSQIAAAVSDAPAELVAVAGALGPADAARRWLDELRHVTLMIDGRDLLRAGIPTGPAIGAGLAGARAAKLDGHVSGRESELAEAIRVAEGH